MDVRMTAKQQRFVLEYLIDLNATQAAIRAGYSPKTAKEIGAQNLTKLNIAAAIAKAQARKREKLEISQDWVLQELAAIAGADASDFAAVESRRDHKWCIHPITGEVVPAPAGWLQFVKVIDTADLPPMKRKALAAIEQTASGGIKIKTYDKVRALELLGKHLGTFDSREAPPAIDNNLFDAIVDASREEVDTDDLPEVEQEAAAGADVVEPPGVQEP